MSIANLAAVRAAAVLLACLAAAPALAAGDAKQGRIVAERWCTSCHAAGRAPTTSDSAPALAVIARQRSPEQLRVWLTEPHAPMPNLSLSRREIDDLVAYIESLSP
jgi:mono/diheme cytochrome c family protein